MIRILHRTIFYIICLFLCGNVSAGDGVRLLSRPTQDSILLRWAPTDKQTWDLGNQYGYTVERYTILREGKLVEGRPYRLLTAVSLKPAPLSEWERYGDDNNVAAAAQCIFDEGESLPLITPRAIERRYRQEQNRFSMALFAADRSVLAARLSGLYLADKDAAKDEKYLYKVYIPLPDSVSAGLPAPLDTAFAFTGISEYQPLPKPLELKARWEDRKVRLSWNILYLGHVYNSYIVEKSPDGRHYIPATGNAFVQAADEDVSPEYAYRTDSLDNNETTWYYRIRGVNAFGETGPPSDSVAGQGRIPLIVPPVIYDKGVIRNREVFLAWTYPQEMDEYISGFRIYHSSKPTGPKEKIYESKSPQERIFTDRNPDLTNYYVISVFDGETERFSSNVTYAELIDSVPPAKPAGLWGDIDSTGIVRIRWNRNMEKDLDGYRVYRSNRPGFEFQLVSPAVVKDTLFRDSVQLKTLTKQVFYRLKAVDLRQNHSEFSEILELRRPDIIPPVAPRIKSIEQQKGKLLISWINSSSEDVVKHHIYRKEKSDSVFILLASIDKKTGTQSTYTDNSVEAGETYIYQMKAEDDSKLLSPPSRPVLQKAPGEIAEKIQLKKREKEDSIQLSWTVKSKKKVARILIYKATGDNPLQLYTNTTEDTFTDALPAPGTTVKYRIKAVYVDESASGLSNEVKN
jgi:fibronectin type 3 domain-containing protein